MKVHFLHLPAANRTSSVEQEPFKKKNRKNIIAGFYPALYFSVKYPAHLIFIVFLLLCSKALGLLDVHSSLRGTWFISRDEWAYNTGVELPEQSKSVFVVLVLPQQMSRERKDLMSFSLS